MHVPGVTADAKTTGRLQSRRDTSPVPDPPAPAPKPAVIAPRIEHVEQVLEQHEQQVQQPRKTHTSSTTTVHHNDGSRAGNTGSRTRRDQPADSGTDGRDLDRQVPPAKRGAAIHHQNRMLQRAKRAGHVDRTPPKGLEGSALHFYMEYEQPQIEESAKNRQKEIIGDYVETHGTWVANDGKVFAATFDESTGDIELERDDEVETGLTDAQIRAARRQQRLLQARVDEVRASAPQAPAGLNGQEARNWQIEQGDAIQAATNKQVAKIEARFYERQGYRVDGDGNVEVAVVDPATGELGFEVQPNSWHLNRSVALHLDGSLSSQDMTTGELPGGRGSETNIATQDVDADGEVVRSQQQRIRTEELASGNMQRLVAFSATGAGGVPIKDRVAITVDDSEGTPQSFTSVRNTYHPNGVLQLSTTHSNVFTPGFESRTKSDTRVNRQNEVIFTQTKSTTNEQQTIEGEGDTPDVELSRQDRLVVTVDGQGESIYNKRGELVVDPVSTLDRTDTTTLLGGGQDDGTDLVEVTTSHAENDPQSGDLVFDDFSHTTQTIDGKDGGKGSIWKTPIDPVTGEPTDAPMYWVPPELQESANRMMASAPGQSSPNVVWSQYGSTAEEMAAARNTAWQKQGLENFDNRTEWRQFQDNATQVAAITAGVAGAGLLFTGIGSGPGAALLAGAAAIAGTVATTSLVADAARGRNHVTWKDAIFAGATMIVPGGAGLIARSARAATLVVKGTAVSLAGFEGVRFADKASGANLVFDGPVTGMDVLNMLAAAGGARYALQAPRFTSHTETEQTGFEPGRVARDVAERAFATAPSRLVKTIKGGDDGPLEVYEFVDPITGSKVQGLIKQIDQAGAIERFGIRIARAFGLDEHVPYVGRTTDGAAILEYLPGRPLGDESLKVLNFDGLVNLIGDTKMLGLRPKHRAEAMAALRYLLADQDGHRFNMLEDAQSGARLIDFGQAGLGWAQNHEGHVLLNSGYQPGRATGDGVTRTVELSPETVRFLQKVDVAEFRRAFDELASSRPPQNGYTRAGDRWKNATSQAYFDSILARLHQIQTTGKYTFADVHAVEWRRKFAQMGPGHNVPAPPTAPAE